MLWPPSRRVVFTEEAKELVRKPLGRLIAGADHDEVALKVKELLEEQDPPIIVVVGDRVSEKLHNLGVPAKIYIVDGKVERKTREIPRLKVEAVERAENPAGEISPEAAEKLHELINSPAPGPIMLLVDGEEDLLALAAILSSPDGAAVVYGQPGVGVVVALVDGKLKKRMMSIVEGLLKRAP